MNRIIVLSALILPMLGCSVAKKLYTPVVSTVPGSTVTNTVYVTNSVVSPTGQTNVTITPITTVTVTPDVLVTNYVKNPAVSTGLDMAGQVGSATGIPWAGTVGAILALLYGIGATLVNASNKNKALAVASTLVDNVEAARDILKSIPGGTEIDKKYVAKIADSQTAKGVREDIHAIVAERT